MNKHNEGFTLIELTAVMAVVVILALMAAPSFLDKFIKNQINEALPLADIAKAPISAAWLTTQTLPTDNASASLPAADKIVSNLVSSVTVEGGAIHITFGNHAGQFIKDKILTLRPAVVVDAPLVPIAWVCGLSTAPGNMTVMGNNKTNIPADYLPIKCR